MDRDMREQLKERKFDIEDNDFSPKARSKADIESSPLIDKESNDRELKRLVSNFEHKKLLGHLNRLNNELKDLNKAEDIKNKKEEIERLKKLIVENFNKKR